MMALVWNQEKHLVIVIIIIRWQCLYWAMPSPRLGVIFNSPAILSVSYLQCRQAM